MKTCPEQIRKEVKQKRIRNVTSSNYKQRQFKVLGIKGIVKLSRHKAYYTENQGIQPEYFKRKQIQQKTAEKAHD